MSEHSELWPKRTGIKVQFFHWGMEAMKVVRGIIPANVDKAFVRDWGINLKTHCYIWFIDEEGKEWRTIVKKEDIKVLN